MGTRHLIGLLVVEIEMAGHCGGLSALAPEDEREARDVVRTTRRTRHEDGMGLRWDLGGRRGRRSLLRSAERLEPLKHGTPILTCGEKRAPFGRATIVKRGRRGFWAGRGIVSRGIPSRGRGRRY